MTNPPYIHGRFHTSSFLSRAMDLTSMATTYITMSHDVYGTSDDIMEEPKDVKLASVERPLLVRTTKLSTITIKLYRLMIIIRMGIFVLFFKWRISSALAMINSTGADDKSTVLGMWMVSIVGELWFALMWVLDQLPKMQPVRRAAYVAALDESMLPAMDVFVTTADADKEPPMVTVNTILSVLAADYPAEKLTCYVSDDGGAPLTRDAVAEAAQFAGLWVPFCRKHAVEPRNPEAYFSPAAGGGAVVKARRGDYKGEAWPELARDRRRVRREYEELRLRIDALQAGDGRRRQQLSTAPPEADGTGSCWPRGTAEDHAGAVELVLDAPGSTPQLGLGVGNNLLDLSAVDVRVPALVYMCREKRRGRAHHGKAGAMNALLRASAVLSNARFVLNLDCDHYMNNSQALRAGACHVLDGGGGDDVAFVQFPQRFDGVDPADRYANHNRVFFDCTELGLDGLQGPIYVGTGCLFRRAALYGVDPPLWRPHAGGDDDDDDAGKGVAVAIAAGTDDEADKLGASTPFLRSVHHAVLTNQSSENQWDTPASSSAFEAAAIGEATALVSCGYEDGTAWGRDVGWMYGTVTEDVATSFCLHRRGWRSAYCATAPDAFRGTAPINLTDRLHQVLRWAAGSLEILFSRNNALLGLAVAGGHRRRLHPLQRLAYLNTTVYPFTSVFLLAYCGVFPAIHLVTGNGAGATTGTGVGGAFFSIIVRPPSATYVAFVAALMATLAAVAVLEARWSGMALVDWWRNQQFWMVSATGAYPAAVAQVALKVAAGREISFKLTSKKSTGAANANASSSGVKADRFAELYAVRWTVLMVPTAAVLAVNLTSMVVAVMEEGGSWRRDGGGAMAVFALAFNAYVVAHLYPFALGLMGRWSNTLSPLLLLVAFFAVRLLCFVLYGHVF